MSLEFPITKTVSTSEVKVIKHKAVRKKKKKMKEMIGEIQKG